MNKFKKIFCDSGRDLKTFWLPWVLLAFMVGFAFIGMPFKSYILLGLMTLFVVILIIKPMNIIYGLIGTHGYIGLFFFRFILIILFFSIIYYGAFFKNAGITYDINQPHVEFNMFEKCDSTEMVVSCDNNTIEFLPTTCKADCNQSHYYYQTGFIWVLHNTFLTSLMQEPSDFFSISSTFTGVKQSKDDPNYILAFTFTCFLIFHILISWILLGVFISLIYQKFRNT